MLIFMFVRVCVYVCLSLPLYVCVSVRAIVFILFVDHNLSRHFSGHNETIDKHVLFVSIII